jgi:hypothetical protein
VVADGTDCATTGTGFDNPFDYNQLDSPIAAGWVQNKKKNAE